MRDTTTPATTIPPGGALTAKAGGAKRNGTTWEVYGEYATTDQHLDATFDTFLAANAHVRRNATDNLTVIKVLADGARTTEF